MSALASDHGDSVVDPIGKVYFLANMTCSTVKVGFTRNLKKRVDVLRTGNHHRLEVCCVLNAPPHVERRIQNALAHFKIRNEWFNHDACVDDLIRKLEEFEIEHGVWHGDFSPVITVEALSGVLEKWHAVWPSATCGNNVDKCDDDSR